MEFCIFLVSTNVVKREAGYFVTQGLVVGYVWGYVGCVCVCVCYLFVPEVTFFVSHHQHAIISACGELFNRVSWL